MTKKNTARARKRVKSFLIMLFYGSRIPVIQTYIFNGEKRKGFERKIRREPFLLLVPYELNFILELIGRCGESSIGGVFLFVR
jgi:hypothetical protein